MAAKHPNRLQNEFLLHLIDEKMLATVSLLGGARLVGTIATFDDFCISLICDGRLQAIYKQEICVISTRGPLSLGPDAPRPKPSPRPVSSRRGVVRGPRGLSLSACAALHRFDAPDSGRVRLDRLRSGTLVTVEGNFRIGSIDRGIPQIAVV